MPSPLGHALGGLAAGWLVAGRRRAPDPDPAAERSARRHPARRAGVVFAGLGMAPDVDLVAGVHSMYTHSVGAVALVTLCVWAWRRERGARWALACGAAVASHLLLDWLGSDTTPPIGIMALWPFSSAFYQSPWFLFPAVSRRVGEWSFLVQNTRAALVELLVLVPVAAAVGWWRTPRP